jgi:hypothetical protein
MQAIKRIGKEIKAIPIDPLSSYGKNQRRKMLKKKQKTIFAIYFIVSQKE